MPSEDRERQYPVIPAQALTGRLPSAIDPDEFTPRLLALLSNALVWRESHELRRRFNLGTNDWRVISAVATRPGVSSTEVSEFLGANKAVVSKSVKTLVKRQLVILVDGPRGSRPMYLTVAGAEMHDLMLPISMRGQEIILSHLTHEDTNRLNILLRRMLEHTKELQMLDSEAIAATRLSAAD